MLTQILAINPGAVSEERTWNCACSCVTVAGRSLQARSSGIHEVQVVATVSLARQPRWVFALPAAGEVVVASVLKEAP
jgi:hypothetical protein